MVFTHSAFAILCPPPSPSRLYSRLRLVSVVFTCSAVAIACPPPSPRSLESRLRLMSVVFTRNTSAITCPPRSLNPHQFRFNTVTLHHLFKPFNLSCSPAPLGDLISLFFTTIVLGFAFSTIMRIVFDVMYSTKVLFTDSIFRWSSCSYGSSSNNSRSVIFLSDDILTSETLLNCKIIEYLE